MAEEIYDVVVIGGGAGGIPAAIRASQLGGRVALIEERDLGGQCMNRGCVPFSHLMAASRIHKRFPLAREMGFDFPEVPVRYPALLRRQEEILGLMRQGLKATLEKNNVKVIQGRAAIAGQGAVETAGRRMEFRKLVLAMGARWRKPDFPGSDLEGVVNTDFLLSTRVIPPRVLLYGTSPWLLEVAQFMRRLDTHVIIATPEKRILPEESKSIASRLRNAFKEDGIDIKTRSAIESVTKRKDALLVALKAEDSREEASVDLVVTLERTAAIRGMGLGTIRLDEDAPFLTVNEKAETLVPGVYAVGDVTCLPARHYSHLAAAMGIAAAENATGKSSSFHPGILPRVLFTQPEIASAGLTPKQAKEKGYEVRVGSAPLSMNPLGMILGENDGLIEVVADNQNAEILGVHIIGTAASEMIGQALMAMEVEITLHELAALPFPHPTLSESLAEAARDALGNPLYLP